MAYKRKYRTSKVYPAGSPEARMSRSDMALSPNPTPESSAAMAAAAKKASDPNNPDPVITFNPDKTVDYRSGNISKNMTNEQYIAFARGEHILPEHKDLYNKIQDAFKQKLALETAQEERAKLITLLDAGLTSAQIKEQWDKEQIQNKIAGEKDLREELAGNLDITGEQSQGIGTGDIMSRGVGYLMNPSTIAGDVASLNPDIAKAQRGAGKFIFKSGMSLMGAVPILNSVPRYFKEDSSNKVNDAMDSFRASRTNLKLIVNALNKQEISPEDAHEQYMREKENIQKTREFLKKYSDDNPHSWTYDSSGQLATVDGFLTAIETIYDKKFSNALLNPNNADMLDLADINELNG